MDVVIDSFVGETGFIRIGGEPIWVQRREDVACDCGGQMTHAASIGYENYDRPSGLLPGGRPFFLGELAFYFFYCGRCDRVMVITQPV
jgi:hypothetical protein